VSVQDSTHSYAYTYTRTHAHSYAYTHTLILVCTDCWNGTITNKEAMSQVQKCISSITHLHTYICIYVHIHIIHYLLSTLASSGFCSHTFLNALSISPNPNVFLARPCRTHRENECERMGVREHTQRESIG